MPAQPSRPLNANYPSEDVILGAGVAIFHLASSRVILCYHPAHDYWFLPKGRKNVNEDIRAAAEREGFEESGYRNRLLPLPHRHCQTEAGDLRTAYTTEALYIQLRSTTVGQYILHWYAAETVPQSGEVPHDPAQPYHPPAPYPLDLTIEARVSMDGSYAPVRHEGTGVDADEAQYESHLVTVEEAVSRLDSSVMKEVVQRAWQGIQLRRRMEKT